MCLDVCPANACEEALQACFLSVGLTHATKGVAACAAAAWHVSALEPKTWGRVRGGVQDVGVRG
eukprot:891009-Pelagomonas_calceolata.AAC.2